MEGKTCVISGANSGIGFETTLALAHKGANIIMICRNPDKGKKAQSQIIDASGNQKVSLVVVDLSSQKSIRENTAKILQTEPVIDVLINNAGTWFSKQIYTEDGVETQFAVNHLSFFLTTHCLLPALRKAADPRIINVSSDSHFQGKMYFGNLNLDRKYHGLRAYAQSKLANVLFTYEFERRKNDPKLSIYAVQPGLVKTDIGLKHTFSLHSLAWKIRRMGGVTPAEGAQTSIYLASSNEVQNMSGKYWDKCKPKPSSKKSYDEQDARKLWDISLQLCKIEDYFGA